MLTFSCNAVDRELGRAWSYLGVGRSFRAGRGHAGAQGTYFVPFPPDFWLTWIWFTQVVCGSVEVARCRRHSFAQSLTSPWLAARDTRASCSGQLSSTKWWGEGADIRKDGHCDQQQGGGEGGTTGSGYDAQRHAKHQFRAGDDV